MSSIVGQERTYAVGIATEASSRRQSPEGRKESLLLASLIGIICLVLGFIIVFKFQYIAGDALSRVLSGFDVVWRGQFHLAAIGLLWNPLPSLISIPFAMIRNIWPPLVTLGFTGNIVTAFFAALGVYHMNQLLRQLGITTIIRVTMVLAFALNPLMLMYGSNGMTDGMLANVLVPCVAAVYRYSTTRHPMHIVAAGTWLALGFMIRYEAVPIAVFMGFGLYIALLLSGSTRKEAEATALALWTPIVMAGIVWIILNWMIMKNPLYFLLSSYGNAKQLSTGAYNTLWITANIHNAGHTLMQVAEWTINFWPFIPVFLITLFGYLRNLKNIFPLPLLAASLGAPALQFLLLYLNKSADWQRFFIYYIPFGMIMLAYILSRIRIQYRVLAGAVTVIMVLSSCVVSFGATNSPQWGHGDISLVRRLLKWDTSYVNPMIIGNEQIGNYISQRPGMKILISQWDNNYTLPFISNPSRVVTTSDTDYEGILENPRGRVDYFLVAPPSSLIKLGKLYKAWPNMWSGGLLWTRLYHEFPDGSKIYEVLPDAP